MFRKCCFQNFSSQVKTWKGPLHTEALLTHETQDCRAGLEEKRILLELVLTRATRLYNGVSRDASAVAKDVRLVRLH